MGKFLQSMVQWVMPKSQFLTSHDDRHEVELLKQLLEVEKEELSRLGQIVTILENSTSNTLVFTLGDAQPQ